jgi:predicted flap endonuclease-1-like 5' DNA nuclease
MGYLLAKIVILLALAALCGFLLARWWLRRSYVEVTEEYSRLLEGSVMAAEIKRGFGARLETLEKSVGALRPPDLRPLTGKLEGIEKAVASYRSPDLGPIESRLEAFSRLGERITSLEESIAQAKPEPPDLGPLTERLEGIERAVASFQPPDLGPIESRLEAFSRLGERMTSLEDSIAQAKPEPPDLGPLNEKLEHTAGTLGNRLASLEASVAEVAPRAPDLGPLAERLEGLQRTLDTFRPLNARIEALEQAVVYSAPDLKPIETRLDTFASFGERLGSLETSITQAAPSAPDLGPVTARLEGLEQAVGSLRSPDLGPIESRLDAFASLGERLGSLESSLSEAAPSPPDLGPLTARIEGLEQVVGSLRSPDLGPLLARLDEIQGGLANMGNADVHHRLDGIEQALAALGSLDLAAVHRRLDEIDQAVAARPSPGPVDLGPVLDRLTALESRLSVAGGPDEALSSHIDGLYRQVDALRPLLERAATRAPTAAEGETPVFRMEDRNLLRRAAFGAPDDLKRIKGIGPALERLLHRLGVYYFWQVADWTTDDVAFMDGKLEIFQGRISWDRWVNQAQRLVEEPGSSRPPESLEARG